MTRSRWAAPGLVSGISLAVTALIGLPIPHGAALSHSAIPAFARKYRTSCSTCHVAFPKLNVLGEAFRLNGYRFPDNDELLRADAPVALGSPEWADLWPRAIMPSDLPEIFPLAARIISDASLSFDDGSDSELRFPNEVYLLAGSTFGSNLSAFLETEWTDADGLEVLQAKVGVADVIPGLPSGALNLWLGQLNPYLFSFADRQVDRAAVAKFAWQTFAPRDLASVSDASDFALGTQLAGVELNGFIAGRLHYGVGVAQLPGSTAEPIGRDPQSYVKLRLKLGGLGVDGRYMGDAEPVFGGGGQLQDRSLIVEGFGYFGEDRDRPGFGSDFAWGLNARMLNGPADFGLGYVRARRDVVTTALQSTELSYQSLFGKLEYTVYPWLIVSLKAERFGVQATETASWEWETKTMPGVIALVRHNFRVVLEGQFIDEAPAIPAAGNAVVVRTEIAF
ncbi:MAG: hypothetical protein ACE5FJ_04955 [Gemmatimonadales bacterium]